MAADGLHVLRMGSIGMPKRWIRVGGSDEYVPIPVLAFLVVSGDRLILIDTGCTPLVAESPQGAWGRLATLYHPSVTADDLIDAQLRKAGFGPHDVTDVVLTHLHMDHVGGLEMVSGARIHVQRAEMRWARLPDHHSGGYYPREFDMEDLDLNLLDGDASVADDVHCVLTHGHTPGHQSVVVDLPSRRVCIVGDAAYNRPDFERRANPAVVWDVGLYMSSISRLATLERVFETELLFSHDAAQESTFPEPSVALT